MLTPAGQYNRLPAWGRMMATKKRPPKGALIRAVLVWGVGVGDYGSY